jgi:Polypeptide deformylase
MTAEATPFRSPIIEESDGNVSEFRWSIDNPPLHARYRAEWKFRNQITQEGSPDMTSMSPAETMRDLGVVQEGDDILVQVARPFDLPAEAENARRVVAQLVSTMDRVAQAHPFTKGLGLAAPQIGIGRAAAVVRTTDGQTLTLLNPRVIDQSGEQEDLYEGCLSFFNVRGKVPR